MIWTTFLPSFGLLIVWIFASDKALAVSAVRTWSTVAFFTSGAVIRVPPSKSMPNVTPLPAIASAPISRMMPDIEKNHLEAPM